MYKLTMKGSEFTIPKHNLRLLAMVKAQDLNKNVQLESNEDAIEFLKSLGVTVEEAQYV